MLDGPLVSVIIPMWNVEKYLEECVESVLNQTYSSIEIILVDDKSPDRSGEIADKLAKQDKRIKVVHKKKNEGLNMARKSGWEVSSGNYITFLDSDDLFHKDNVKNSLEAMRKSNVNMVIYGKYDFSDDTEIKSRSNHNIIDSQEIYNSKLDAFRLLIVNDQPDIVSMSVWGKLYRRELVERVDWQTANYKAYEDNFWIPQIYDQIESFVILRQPLYCYRRNDGDASVLSKSLTGNTHNGRKVGYLQFIDEQVELWNKYIKKNHLKLADELDRFRFQSYMYRINNLIKADLLQFENNMEYFIKFYLEYQQRVGREIELLREQIDHCRNERRKEEEYLKTEYNRLLHSKTYKVGNAILIPLRTLRHIFRK